MSNSSVPLFTLASRQFCVLSKWFGGQEHGELELVVAGTAVDVQYLSADDAVCIVSDTGDVVLYHMDTKQVRIIIHSSSRSFPFDFGSPLLIGRSANCLWSVL
jgi:hypothetical protein